MKFKIQKSFAWVLLAVFLISFLNYDARANETDAYVPNQLVCAVLTPDVIDSIHAVYGTTTLQELPQIGGYLLEAPGALDIVQAADEIALMPGVVYCELNYLLNAPEPVQSSQPFLDENLIGSFPDQQAAQSLNLTLAHTQATGMGVSVAVIDVGVNLETPLLAGKAFSGFDYVDGDPNAGEVPGGTAAGHGTFIAGIVNLTAPDAQITAYRVLDTAGQGNGYTIAEAVLQAVEDGNKVINLSLVMGGKHATLDDAISYAHDNNVLVIAAAGNDSTDVDKFPARDSYTLAVAGVDTLNMKADFSNYNSRIDVCAPATDIYSPLTDSSFAWWDGTSFAAPFVAGLAALLYAQHPDATWGEIVDAITLTADNIDDLNPGLEGMLGAGVINPVSALSFLTPATCGDVNGDESINVGDPVFLIHYIFQGGPPPVSMSMSDVNADGHVNLGDSIYLINYIFKQGEAPNCS